MKITKQYLKQLISEELSNMGEAGEQQQDWSPDAILVKIEAAVNKAKEEKQKNPTNAKEIVSELILDISQYRGILDIG